MVPLGLFILGLGTLGNFLALALAPVMVVQPIGAFSLIVSVLLGVRYRGLKVNRRLVQAVVWCTLGVTVFVALSATTARTQVHLGADAMPLVWITGVIVVLGLIIMVAFRRAPRLVLITAAGLLFACVATNAHLVSVQYLRAGIENVTWQNIAQLVAAAALGSWFVQNSYAAGPRRWSSPGSQSSTRSPLSSSAPSSSARRRKLPCGRSSSSRSPDWSRVSGSLYCLGIIPMSEIARTRAGRPAKY